MDWHPTKDVFLFHSRCSQDSLWMHSSPDQNKSVTEDYLLSVTEEWINEVCLVKASSIIAENISELT